VVVHGSGPWSVIGGVVHVVISQILYKACTYCLVRDVDLQRKFYLTWIGRAASFILERRDSGLMILLRWGVTVAASMASS
jgi:hypothetical protein